MPRNVVPCRTFECVANSDFHGTRKTRQRGSAAPRRTPHAFGATKPPPPDPLFTTAEAAAYTRFSQETVRRAARKGVLRSAKTPSGLRRYRRSWLDAWVGVAVVLAVLCAACVAGLELAQDVMRWLGCPMA
jgi:excisionase family DNA binding protein